jgi:putative endonuclease
MGRTQTIGREAEDRACAFLHGRGLRVIERNFRCRGGEIDLIMRDGGTLVFVEVRLRSRPEWGGAAASIDRHKQRRLTLAAQHYLVRRPWPGPCRFDVVALDGADDINWIRDAIGG